MHWLAVTRDIVKEMCKSNSEGKERVNGRQLATGEGFGRAYKQKGEK
jgi:hypothetical protein